MEYEGHNYVIKSTNKATGVVYYVCQKFRKGCQARLTVHNERIEVKKSHSCGEFLPSCVLDVRREMRQLLIDQARQHVSDAPSAIWDRIMALLREKYPTDGLNAISKQPVVNIIKNTRAQMYGNDSFRAIGSPEVRCVSTSDSRSFLQFNVVLSSQKSQSRLVGFGHPDLCGFYIPVLYVLVTGKDQDTYYCNVLNLVIIQSDRRLDPDTVACDFELALVNAVQEQFSVKIVGCLFHWKQALRKKMIAIGIPIEQVKDSMSPGKVDVLTIIPACEISEKGIRYVKSVVGEQGAKGKWDQFWRYFRSTWLARFPPNLWNVAELESDRITVVNRTNNALESYNRTFSEKFGRSRPSLLSFMNVSKQESLRYVQWIEDIKHSRQEPPDHATEVTFLVPHSYHDFD